MITPDEQYEQHKQAIIDEYIANGWQHVPLDASEEPGYEYCQQPCGYAETANDGAVYWLRFRRAVISDDELKALVNAEIVAKLTEAVKPYFIELDNFIVNGDPTGEVESGRLWARHFPDTENEVQS